MKQEIPIILGLATTFLLLFGLSEVLYHKFQWRVELTRKISHIGTGILSLLFPFFLESHWSVLLLSFSFLILLILSIKFNFLKSINKIDRTSYGSVLYPISVYTCFYTYKAFNEELIYFYLPVLILAICDPVAAFVGKRKPFGKYTRGTKTLAGSLGFFVSATLLAIFLFKILIPELMVEQIILYAIGVALSATVFEALSGKGLDNLMVPAVVLSVLYGLL